MGWPPLPLFSSSLTRALLSLSLPPLSPLLPTPSSLRCSFGCFPLSFSPLGTNPGPCNIPYSKTLNCLLQSRRLCWPVLFSGHWQLASSTGIDRVVFRHQRFSLATGLVPTFSTWLVTYCSFSAGQKNTPPVAADRLLTPTSRTTPYQGSVFFFLS
ncbi:hypothetical protein M440DRAFT_1400752 [Trichoderma longibrachiatum ATCC 18648]|uniref:Secreted protein n=1 Tax=Trichoderma longibrachiatum ATCC 18648 TaxID=983965 RepID=A0A2T4C8F4_TRILO|nr:hypothetical protein M440DRAFT_1400752 [Trichoderma longibrachiatum ATCC 18648]